MEHGCIYRKSLALVAMQAHGTAVLLNVHTERFHLLNELSLYLWRALTEEQKTIGEVIDLLADRYPVTRDHLTSDVHVCIEQFLHERLLLPIDDPVRPELRHPFQHASPFSSLFALLCLRGWKRLPILEAYLTLGFLHHALLHGRFLDLIHHLQALPAHHLATDTTPDVTTLCTCIRRAARLHRFRARCLHQSLALCWMLRKRQIRADLVIGVYTHPFSSHAWVISGDHLLQWRAGMGPYPDQTRLAAMSVIFHSAWPLSIEGDSQ